MKRVKERVNHVILSNLERSRCTVVSDSWSNVQRRPLINVMVVSPHGKQFLKAKDSSKQIETGAYIAHVVASAIDAMGAMNVVQVIMDNSKNCIGCRCTT